MTASAYVSGNMLCWIVLKIMTVVSACSELHFRSYLTVANKSVVILQITHGNWNRNEINCYSLFF